MGAATSLAVLGSGVLRNWTDERALWPRAVLVGLLWGALFGWALVLAKAGPVRAMPRRQTILIWLVTAVLVAVTMATGQDLAVAYPVGAAATFGVWALGAVWGRR
jgi:hypothetical protein